MASLFSETFDAGPANGTALTTSNVAFSSFSGTAPITFDSAAAMFGNFGMKVVGSATFAYGQFIFGSAQTNAYISCFMKISAAPAATEILINVLSGATNRAQVGINAAGNIVCRSPATVVTSGTSSGTYADGLWSRFEWSLVGTVQTLNIFRGAHLLDSTPTETLAGGAGSITVSGFDRFRFGLPTADSITFYGDGLQVDGAAMPAILTEHNQRVLGIC